MSCPLIKENGIYNIKTKLNIHKNVILCFLWWTVAVNLLYSTNISWVYKKKTSAPRTHYLFQSDIVRETRSRCRIPWYDILLFQYRVGLSRCARKWLAPCRVIIATQTHDTQRPKNMRRFQRVNMDEKLMRSEGCRINICYHAEKFNIYSYI